MIQRIKTIFHKTPIWVKKFITCIFLSTCICLAIKHNLNTYSLYYAQHIPHKDGVYPEVVLLMDHLETINFPYIDNLQWGFNDPLDSVDERSIIHWEDDQPTLFMLQSYESIQYTLVKKNGEYLATWNPYGRLVQATFFTDLNPDHPYPQKEDHERVRYYYNDLTKPIYQAQKEPIINLQWLFNLYYYDRFSRGAK